MTPPPAPPCLHHVLTVSASLQLWEMDENGLASALAVSQTARLVVPVMQPPLVLLPASETSTGISMDPRLKREATLSRVGRYVKRGTLRWRLRV